MRLIPDWRRVLARAWSVRLGLIAGFLEGLSFFIQLTVGQMPEVSFWLRAVSGLVMAAAFIARFVAQPSMHNED